MEIEIVAEEIVGTYTNPHNGAGPLWCYGSPTIVRDGMRVFASLPETGKDVKPLCNTRWQLFRRPDGGSWERLQSNTKFNEREPCPLLRLPRGRIVLSTNPTVSLTHEGPDGIRAYECEPRLLQFSAVRPDAACAVLEPQWDRPYHFTEHSYRGCAADWRTGEMLLLHQTLDDELSRYAHSPVYSQAWAYMDGDGVWCARGLLRFPVRGCYPQVAVVGGAAYVMAVSDIMEPVPEWRAHKKEVTGKQWDYDFRQLFFTYTPDIMRVPFSPALTIASRDETAGVLRNSDMWIDPDGDAHIIYSDRTVWHKFMRDKFFPELPITMALRYCRIRGGAVVERRTLVECEEDPATIGKPGATAFGQGCLVPGDSALHVTPDDTLFVLYHVTGHGASEAATGNYLMQLHPHTNEEPVKLDLQYPLTSFFTASTRMGSEPCDVVDMFGAGPEPDTIRYAQIELRF